MGLAIGGIIYAIVVVLRISTDQCSIVVQEIIFMVVGGGIGWAVGSGFDIMGNKFYIRIWIDSWSPVRGIAQDIDR